MIVEHLTEKEIQQYATDKQGCEITTVEHLEICEYCNARVASYQLIFTAIRELSAPVNGFDLSSLVMSKINQKKKCVLPDDMYVYLLVLVAVVFTGATLYPFRYFFLQLVRNFSYTFVYSAAIAVFTILLFQLIESYKKYQRKMDALNIV